MKILSAAAVALVLGTAGVAAACPGMMTRTEPPQTTAETAPIVLPQGTAGS